MSVLYFAYGSNLLPARLQHRCPSARKIGTANAVGFGLDFSKPGADDSGKATIFEAQGSVTPGALYEIAEEDMPTLDLHESAGVGYRREDAFSVRAAGSGDLLLTTTYIAIDRQAELVPHDWYLALCLSGARHHGLDADHILRFEQQDFTVDDEVGREMRVAALKAFEAHGIANFRQHLGRLKR